MSIVARSEVVVFICTLAMPSTSAATQPWDGIQAGLQHADKPDKCRAGAGLWEFPAVKVPADANAAECRRSIDRLLEGPLGVPLAEEHVVSRQGLGEVVHIFSHIRMTMRVEHIVLKVRAV